MITKRKASTFLHDKEQPAARSARWLNLGSESKMRRENPSLVCIKDEKNKKLSFSGLTLTGVWMLENTQSVSKCRNLRKGMSRKVKRVFLWPAGSSPAQQRPFPTAHRQVHHLSLNLHPPNQILCMAHFHKINNLWLTYEDTVNERKGAGEETSCWL